MGASDNQMLDVIIVGAGPVGLTCALELNRQGANVRLIEASADRANLSKAVGINAQILLTEPGGYRLAL